MNVPFFIAKEITKINFLELYVTGFHSECYFLPDISMLSLDGKYIA